MSDQEEPTFTPLLYGAGQPVYYCARCLDHPTSEVKPAITTKNGNALCLEHANEVKFATDDDDDTWWISTGDTVVISGRNFRVTNVEPYTEPGVNYTKFTLVPTHPMDTQPTHTLAVIN